MRTGAQVITMPLSDATRMKRFDFHVVLSDCFAHYRLGHVRSASRGIVQVVH
jgi:hypothetical protein